MTRNISSFKIQTDNCTFFKKSLILGTNISSEGKVIVIVIL